MKLLFYTSLIICFISCQSSKNQDNNEKKSTKNTENTENKITTNLINDPRSPNPSSELAVIMRDMWEYTDTLKMAIQNKTVLPDYRSRFEKVHKSIPTDAKTKSPAFDAMATMMLQKLENVYQNAADNEQQSVQVEGFNLLIKSCLQCHEQQCPGPISRISKLTIKKETK